MVDLDPLAFRVARRFGTTDPDLKLNHVRRLTQALLERLQSDPHIPMTDLVSALMEIANEAKVSR